MSRPVDIPLAQGIDQAADPKVKPWTITEADNLRFDRPGELAPRDPVFQEYNPGANIRTRRMVDLNGSVGALVESAAGTDFDLLLSRRNDTTGAWSVSNNAAGSKGNVASAGLDGQYVPLVSDVKRTVIWQQQTGQTYTVYNHSMAAYSDYRMHAVGFSNATRIYFYRGDQLIQTSDEYAAITRPKVFSLGASGWLVTGIRTSDNLFVAIKVTTVVPAAWPAATDDFDGTLAVNASYRNYDAVVAGDYLYVTACHGIDGLSWYRIATATLVMDLATTFEAAAQPTVVAMSADAKTVVWRNTGGAHDTDTHGAVVDITSGVVVVAAQDVVNASSHTELAVGGGWSSTVSVVLGSKPTSPDLQMVDYPTFNKTTGVISNLQGRSVTFQWQIASAPIYVYGKEFIGGIVSDMEAAAVRTWRFALFMIDTETYEPFPVMTGDHFGGYYEAQSHWGAEHPSYVGGRMYFSVVERSEDAKSTAAVLYDMAINGLQVGQAANDGQRGSALLSGGAPVLLDDRGSVEPVPFIYPHLEFNGTSGTGITGSVSFIGVFEVEDSHGRLGWSAPSVSIGPTALVNQGVVVRARELHVTRMPTGIEPKLRLYRSTDSGPYYLSSVTTLTRTTTGYVDITDSTQDLSANEMLYSDGTEGAEAERFLPPFSTVVAVHKTRAWSASGKRVYFSQLFDSDFMPQFTDVFYVEVPARVTGLASAGDFLWILTEDPDGLYYVTGDGPDATGASGWYASPSPIAGAPGLPQELGGQNSVLVADGVLYYRSARGIEASSGGQVQLISEPIRETLASYPVVLSASWWPEKGELVWLCGVDSGATGRKVFVYNTRVKAWTTYSSGGYTSADTAAYYSNGLVMGGRVGVWRTDAADTADETAAAARTAITTTLTVEGHPFGLNGFGMVKEIAYVGTGGGKFSTELTVTTDGTVVENADAHTFEETDFVVGADLALPHQLWEPRCSEALIQIRSTGLTQSGSIRLPPTWHGVAVEVERLPGSRRAISAEAF